MASTQDPIQAPAAEPLSALRGHPGSIVTDEQQRVHACITGHDPDVGEISAADAWDELQQRGTRILDLRTSAERRRYGAPPGATPVSLVRHAVTPDRAAIYLCQHAVRSKLPAQRGAREIAGGFVAWQKAGLPIETVDD